MRWMSTKALAPHVSPSTSVQPPVFVFSGQGSQWAGMGRSLLEHAPVFRDTLEACDAHVRRLLDWSLVAALTADEGESRLGDIGVSCPAIVSMEIALAAQWRAWGIEPAAVVGHSIGEVTAAHVAGVLSLEDAMRVICSQGRCLQRISGQGAMGMVGLSWKGAGETRWVRERRLWRAIHAGPDWTVLSGETAILDEALATLRRQGVVSRRVAADVAVHCPLVDPLGEELYYMIEDIQPQRARLPIASSVTGSLLEGSRFDADYWVRNLTDPVLFCGAIDALLANHHEVFLEVSPHPLVKHSLESILQHAGQQGTLLATMRRGKDPREEMRGTLQALDGLGQRVCWAEVSRAGIATPDDEAVPLAEAVGG